ncbi:MAG: hypothetical protein Q7U12_18135 [Undibacterium sp.]|nr:hypothetical protein [Undibacterium sp.]
MESQVSYPKEDYKHISCSTRAEYPWFFLTLPDAVVPSIKIA